MKTKFVQLICGVAMLGTAISVTAQTATPLEISSGFNADLIADGSGSASGSASAPFDGGNVFYDSTYLSNHPGGNSGVFPSGGIVTGNSGNQYDLAAATGNNALRLLEGDTSGTLDLVSPAFSLASIYVLGSSADGPSLLDYTLNFAGGNTSSGSFTFADWFDPGQTGEITGLSHVGLDDTYSWQGNVFSLYAAQIDVPLEDQALALQSISFTFADSGSTAAIFALSATPAPEPSTLALAAMGGLGSLLMFRRRK
jgi:hypothetical protein